MKLNPDKIEAMLANKMFVFDGVMIFTLDGIQDS